MQYFTFNNLQIPLSCVTGFSYSRNANIVPTSKLSCKCLGINPMQVQLQLTLNSSTCYTDNFQGGNSGFLELARAVSQIRPSKTDKPSFIQIGDNVIIPQMKFMLISTNLTYQSDRLGNLQEMQASWTLGGTQVVKDENRNTELKSNSEDLLPKVILHCKGKSIECSQDISIADLKLSGFKGSIQLMLADTYTEVDRDTWLADVNDSEDSYFEIAGYGKFYIIESYVIYDNWLNFELTKFSKKWYQKHTETLISTDKVFTLADAFESTRDDVEVKSKAKFEYFKFDDTPISVLRGLQDSLGYLIGLRNDKIYLYDAPDKIGSGQITYDYVLDNDVMTTPITKVIIRDGYGEYSAGNDKGETFSVNAICRVTSETSENVLKYAQFSQNMLILTIPLETRINIGSIVNINTGDSVINCVVTEFDIDFLSNTMKLELHYVER